MSGVKRVPTERATFMLEVPKVLGTGERSRRGWELTGRGNAAQCAANKAARKSSLALRRMRKRLDGRSEEAGGEHGAVEDCMHKKKKLQSQKLLPPKTSTPQVVAAVVVVVQKAYPAGIVKRAQFG